MNESPRNTRLIRMHRACNYPLSLATEVLRNRGLLAEGAYVRVANGYFWFKRRLLNVLLTKLAGADGESLAFDEQFRGVFLETLRNSNHRLADLIEVDLASYGYRW